MPLLILEMIIHSRLRNINCLERLNKDVRRREKVKRIFLDGELNMQLISCLSAH
ncbi:MAG: transposase [Peptoniphilus grossensis]|uniref:transposase n=1 Tax=Anaerococcus vaginalis TaxID=33037 RepID=UPI001D4F4111|nr:transposase [Anaerococcus vaginalis]